VTLSLLDLLLLLVLGGYGLHVFQSIRVRELALAAARNACRQAGVQLLDETVSVQRRSASRDAAGRWRIWRQYRFEYSIDGYEREPGHVIMLGNRVQGLVMADRPTLH
jgi:hypothetical protein